MLCKGHMRISCLIVCLVLGCGVAGAKKHKRAASAKVAKATKATRAVKVDQDGTTVRGDLPPKIGEVRGQNGGRQPDGH